MSLTAASGSSSNTVPCAGYLPRAERHAFGRADGRPQLAASRDRRRSPSRLRHGRDHDHADRSLARPALHRGSELGAAQRLVGDDQDLRRGRHACTCSASSCGSLAGLHHRVPRAGHAVLVRSADDLGDLVEVEDRRRRGHLPLERESAPRVGLRDRAASPADHHVVDEDDERRRRARTSAMVIAKLRSPNASA